MKEGMGDGEKRGSGTRCCLLSLILAPTPSTTKQTNSQVVDGVRVAKVEAEGLGRPEEGVGEHLRLVQDVPSPNPGVVNV